MTGLPYWLCIAVILALLVTCLVRLGGATLFVLHGYREEGGKKFAFLLLGLLPGVLLLFLIAGYAAYLSYAVALAALLLGILRNRRGHRLALLPLLALMTCVLAMRFGLEAFSSYNAWGLGIYSGYERHHELFTKGLGGLNHWHPADQDFHASA